MINAAAASAETIQEAAVFVGKDVLELLSSSMYVNPLVIYREYVQNATDAIDDAVAAGLLSSVDDGLIEISLDHIDRRVVIRDNGTGVPNTDFPARMLSFGASAKRGTGARGFRGVGRLAGLGYVQTLVFRSKAPGDTRVMEATWDMLTVKRMLVSSTGNTDLKTVVRKAVTLKTVGTDDYPAHFFEVELVKPRRIANDRLLNEVEIASYVGQTCPCPLMPAFSHGRKVAKLLAPHGRASRSYKIHINGASDPVYRPYRDEVTYSDTKTGSMSKKMTPIIIEKADDQGLAAVGWFVHHDYQGAIPASQGIRGLRARVGNIQIGNERLFAEVFPEDRFCSWAVGEVHILDDRIVPNGRRDAFETSMHLDHLITHLRLVGAAIARECRLASQKRHRRRTIELGVDKIYEKLEVIKQGAVSTDYAKAIEDEVHEVLSEMKTAADFQLFKQAERRALRSQLKAVTAAVGTATERAADGDMFACLPASKRAVYREVFDLVYTCSVNQVAAKNLIDRMLERLSHT